MNIEQAIENTIRHGGRQKDVAEVYAMAIASSRYIDWRRVNGAVAARWPKGLVRVKTMAWRILRRLNDPSFGVWVGPGD